jgi:hypothetical protein
MNARGRHTLSVLLTAMTLAALAAPAGASAPARHFKGSADSDAQTEITFEVEGKTVQKKVGKKTKKVFAPTTVSDVHVINQITTCYDQSGKAVQSERFTNQYEFFAIEPMKVSRSGHFAGTAEVKAPDGAIISRVDFDGTFRSQGRKVFGAFQAQYAAGGIEYGYCGDNGLEPYTARG